MKNLTKNERTMYRSTTKIDWIIIPLVYSNRIPKMTQLIRGLITNKIKMTKMRMFDFNN